MTNAEIEFLRLAIQSEIGNPWHSVTRNVVRVKMLESLKERGYFDGNDCITQAGRDAVA